MPGDEVHEEAGTPAQQAADAGRGRTGPRHAAPRKPLLNRLHVPAGKAIAMAAMPSAVLMGMGITPQLASAKPLPKSPFKGGSCVSQPDKDDTQDKEDKERAAKIKAAKEKAEAKKKAEAEKERESSNGDGSGSSKPEPSPSESSSSGGSGGGSAEPEPSPSESEEEDDGGLLGGVGDAIGDVLSPEEKKEKAEEEAEEKAEAAPSPSASDSGSGSSKSGTEPAEDALGKVGDGLKDTTDKLGKTAEGALPGKKSEEALPGKKSQSQKAGKGGKKDFPCVEEKKVAGDDEQTPATLPNDPWTLKASSLGLHGLDYEGVVNIRTANGKTKQALKFTAKSVDIGDLHQIVQGPDGTKHHVQAAKGSTSTIRDGQVTMYTERLKGNLFGLIPIVFDPEHPPPLNIPEAYFTNVEVSQAGQFGGNLTVPGLRQSID